MKDKYIIPIFISHKGCPNQCTFCNQKKISGSVGDIDINKIRNEIEEWLEFLPKNLPIGTCYFGRDGICQNNTSLLAGSSAEIAFFGGSFTGIDKSIQEELLILANEYIKANKVR